MVIEQENVFQENFSMAASVLYVCGYLFLLWKGTQYDPNCNYIVSYILKTISHTAIYTFRLVESYKSKQFCVIPP